MASRNLLHAGHDHEESSGDDDDDDNLLIFQLVAIPVVFLCTMLGVIVPFWLRKHDLNRAFFGFLNVFSGGIFLGFAFLHILPDGVEGFNDYYSDVKNYPIIYAIALCGFFFVMLIEQYTAEKTQSAAGSDELELSTKSSTTDIEGDPHASDHSHGHSHDSHGHSHSGPSFHSHSVRVGKSEGIFKPLAMMACLSIHALFEGLALGFAKTTLSFLLLTLGILLHKWGEAMGMSVGFIKSQVPAKHWVGVVAIFASVCPLGIAIGILLSQVLQGAAADIVMSVLSGFAAGALMEVALLGVVLEELVPREYRYEKFALMMLSVLCMGCLMMIE